MIEALLLKLLSAVITVLLGILAWIGSRVHQKLDALGDKLENGFKDTNRTLASIERDLREDLVAIDKRVTVLESTRD